MLDIATALCMMFAFTAANHLGLVSKLESIIGHPIPIVNCPKCSTFWSTLIYMLIASRDIIGGIAMSFFFAYLAIWVELAMGVADCIYMDIYEKIISRTTSAKTTSGAAGRDTSSTLSNMRKK